MTRPFGLVQLSDPHIGAEWADGDPVAGLAAAVASVRSLLPQPDAVLVSGDLADHATDAEYEQARELLAPLDAAPVRTPRQSRRSPRTASRVQARLDFTSDMIELAAEPAGFAVHAVLDGDVISHIQPVH